MRVLIIGGTRYLGREVVARLVARGDAVTVANRAATPGELPASVQRVQADLSEPGSLERALGALTFDAAINMIASSAASAHEALVAVADSIGHYVQCGSTGVYAPLQHVPADESHPDQLEIVYPEAGKAVRVTTSPER